MHVESLKVFCDLVSLRSFSKAAKANGTSQPTVSRVVHQLEERLGGQLIDRSKRPLQLTSLGQAYYEGCKALLDRYIELEASLRRGNGDMALSVRVAAIYSVGLWDMGQYTREFEVRYPHAKVHIDYLHPNQVYERVQNGAADLGLVSFPKGSKELSVLPWREEEMVVACAPDHAWARSRGVAPRQLDGQRFVAFDKGLVIRNRVDRFLKDHGVAVEVAAEFDNIETIKKGIEAGVGVGLLPEPMLRQEVQAGTLRAVRLDGCRLMRPVGIVHRRHHRPSAAVTAFIGQLQGKDVDKAANGKPHAAKIDHSKRTTR